MNASVVLVHGFGASPDKDSVLVAIGHAAQSGAQLEYRLSMLAAALLALRQRIGLFILGRNSASRLFTTLRKTLAVIADHDLRQRLSLWLADAQGAYDDRNAAIHSQIAHDSSGGRLYWVKLSAKLEGIAFEYEAIDLKQLRAIGQRLDELCGQFDAEICSLLITRLPHTREALGHPPF